MRLLSFLLVFTAAAWLLGPSPVEAQDRPFFRALLGTPNAEKPRTVNRAKRVEIDLTAQRLRAYEGNRLVMQTRISSGRGGSTPTGRYSAGPYKSERHFSSLYNNAPMPWSVQVSGHIFIHGFSEVPNYPASHGCIRLPISGANPARRFYRWVDVGTPIRIFY